MEKKILSCKHVYFLGIGGIGMSALARYIFQHTIKVSGYDRDETELTKKLVAQGIHIQYHDVEIPADVDMIIYTPALKAGQREYDECVKSGLRMLKRSQALEEILKSKKVIGVAGTHGKTTTSALLAHILYHSGNAITAFVGGVMKNYNSNFLFADNDWVLVEADEFDRSFLRLFPTIALIQAIDPDHLDIYNTAEEVVEGFKQFTLQIKPNGILCMEAEVKSDKMDVKWRSDLDDLGVDIRSFGIASGDLSASHIRAKEGQITWQLLPDKVELSMCMIGEHNIKNALGACLIANELGVSKEEMKKALATFKGIERRMEYVYSSPSLVIIDDYAHHPEEIKAAIKAVRKSHPQRKLTVVFQPHLFTRTRDFMNEFAASLSSADEIILTDIYPAREKPIDGITSSVLLERIENSNKHLVHKDDLIDYFKNKKIELLLFMGAGDTYKKIEAIKHILIG